MENRLIVFGLPPKVLDRDSTEGPVVSGLILCPGQTGSLRSGTAENRSAIEISRDDVN